MGEQCSLRRLGADVESILVHPAQEWSKSTAYAPPALHHRCACAQQALERYICSLPPTADRNAPAAYWAFGGIPPTLGKFVARWAMKLWIGLALERRRFTLDANEHEDWQAWAPAGCAQAEWLRSDVCAVRGTISDAERIVVERLLEPLKGNLSGRAAEKTYASATEGGTTFTGLWVAGAVVRLARTSVGSCGAAAVPALGGPRRRRGGMGSSVVAVHMRRGDACERWGRAGSPMPTRRDERAQRACYPVEDYLVAAESLAQQLQTTRRRRTGLRLLAVSDSTSAIAELRALAASRAGVSVEVSRLPLSATWGGAADGAVLGKTVGRSGADSSTEFIEQRNKRGLVNRTEVFASLLADLELASEAEAFVGTSCSFVSRLCLLSAIGGRAQVVPFRLLDAPLSQLWFAPKLP